MFLTLGVSTRPSFSPISLSRPLADHAWILPTRRQSPTGYLGTIGKFTSGIHASAFVRVCKAEMGLGAFGSGLFGSASARWLVGPRMARLADGINGSGAADLPVYWSVPVHERGVSRPKKVK